jgi:tetratricopeptide (TPR) repeat protein
MAEPEFAGSQLPPVSAESRRIATEQFGRANQVIATGNHDYGIQLLLSCCKLDPANLTYRAALRRAQKAKYGNNLRGSRMAILTVAPFKSKMKSARRNREFVKVLEHGEEVLTRNPWDMATQMEMSEAADALGLSEIAIFLLDQARQKHGAEPDLNRALARLFEKTGDFGRAMFLWELVKQADPSDVEAQHKAKDLAASETIARGQYEENAEGKGSGPILRHKTPTTKPGKPNEDKFAQETAAILTRIDADPTQPSLYLQLAGLYRSAGQLDPARAVLNQGLGPTGSDFRLQLELLEIDLEPFRNNLARTDEKIKKMGRGEPVGEQSEEDLQKIRAKLVKEINTREADVYRLKVDRFPSDLSNRLELGIRLLQVNLLDEAITELQQARKDGRFAWKALMNLGVCWKKRNNWRLAQRNFEDALQQMPASEEGARKETLYELARGFAETGDLARALDLGHELANLDFGYRDIGRLLDDWQVRLQQA